jgi:REP element-mobilizing transposase RayT
MARPLRIERVGCWYHVTARGNERRDIFREDKDRRHFLELLETAVAMFALRLHAYVLMSNHYHLLVELTEANLARAMHWLNVSYTVWFNRRHGRSGHLFQGRFKSVVVEPEGWGLEVSRYLHLNPVRLRRHGLGKRELQRSRKGVRKGSGLTNDVVFVVQVTLSVIGRPKAATHVISHLRPLFVRDRHTTMLAHLRR